MPPSGHGEPAARPALRASLRDDVGILGHDIVVMPRSDEYHRPANVEAPHRRRQRAMQSRRGRTPTRIKVAGVGGGGGKALNRMISAAVRGVEFIAVNTDLQALERCNADVKVNVGRKLTHGLGAGGDWATGQAAAAESRRELASVVRGADLLFIVTGTGGGTGTGASGVLAEVARGEGVLTIGVVTRPFRFEGKVRNRTARTGIEYLRDRADALIVVPNDRLSQVVEHKTTLEEAFRIADDVLRLGVQAIVDLIVNPGILELPLADVRSMLAASGECRLGIGFGTGERRAEIAATRAVASPLLETSIGGARGVLFNITAGSDMRPREGEAAVRVVRASAPGANVVFGVVNDERMRGEARITLVATGLPDRRPQDQEPLWPSGVPALPRPRMGSDGAAAWPSGC
jgi:cell division protein FtsZ